MRQPAPGTMNPSPIRRCWLALLGGIALTMLAASAMAEQVSREQDIADLRLGQKIQVDDGSCPAGEIKEVSGSKMTPTGVLRVRKCVPRLGPKRK